ncbi:hypothetical protein Pan153_61650 [Gimesia panareensis]|uniref:Uncharacterized protein n=1 Tax=Gimesia panareensis TaxID=2527978 RepID=A0A518FYN0_9PLAN|nr:DUF6304 family protein [Gimesia panareensis]QDV21477.1 hypothetical protein Pan153_61650 [Gimesia panareensis]
MNHPTEKPTLEQPPFQYTDREGTIVGTMTNDGSDIRVNLDGWEFVGKMFDDLEPVQTAGLPVRFRLSHEQLCDCEFEFAIPVLMNDRKHLSYVDLSVKMELGTQTERGGLDREELRVSLEYGTQKYVSSGKSGWMEDELLEIQKQLPDDVFIQACINCLYSDYSPFGCGAFGCMMCFRNLKQEYLQVKSKDDFWSVHDDFERLVQETWLCDEFERRVPGTGYRG